MPDIPLNSFEVAGTSSRALEGVAMTSYSAGEIAKWFVAYANADDADITNLKLQKLLYYAQGHHFELFGTPLFLDPIQAWAHGPVVAAVYHDYKAFGNGNVELDADDPFDWQNIDEDTTQFLLDIWDKYGCYAAWRLRDMTHNEAPWAQTFVPDARNLVIPADAIKSYFRRGLTSNV